MYVHTIRMCYAFYLTYLGLHKYQQRGMQRLQHSLHEFPSKGTGEGLVTELVTHSAQKFTLLTPCKGNSLDWWSPSMLIVTHTITYVHATH